MNPKQKKFLLIAGIAVAVFYFAPSFINSYRRAAFIREQNEARLAKPPAAKGASPLPGSGIAPSPAAGGTIPGGAATSVSPQFDNVLGVWQGVALVPSIGNCNMKLELRPAPEPGQPASGQITGFPVLVCAQMPILATGAKALAEFTPASAVITGKPAGKSVEFTVDKIISKGQGRCAFTAFTVTPFGSDQIAAEWKEDDCPAGQMLLRRIGK